VSLEGFPDSRVLLLINAIFPAMWRQCHEVQIRRTVGLAEAASWRLLRIPGACAVAVDAVSVREQGA